MQTIANDDDGHPVRASEPIYVPPNVETTLTLGERFPPMLSAEPDNDPLPLRTRLPRLVIDDVGYTVEDEDLAEYARFFEAA